MRGGLGSLGRGFGAGSVPVAASVRGRGVLAVAGRLRGAGAAAGGHAVRAAGVLAAGARHGRLDLPGQLQLGLPAGDTDSAPHRE